MHKMPSQVVKIGLAVLMLPSSRCACVIATWVIKGVMFQGIREVLKKGSQRSIARFVSGGFPIVPEQD